MRVVLQRVRSASVTAGNAVLGEIGVGYLLLLGVAPTDRDDEVEWMADKITGLRLFADTDGKMNLDLAAAGGAVLVVSQFTLYGDASRGRRPSFIKAASPEIAIPIYQRFITRLRAAGVAVATGEFGADMKVSLVNDGPVTLVLDREAA